MKTPSLLGDMLQPRDAGLLADLVGGIRESLAADATPVSLLRLSSGERLRWPSAENRRIYLVESGVVLLEHFSPTGRRTILDLLPPNEFFGEDELPGFPSQYLPSAFTCTSLLSVEQARFQQVVRQERHYDAWRASLVLRARRHRSLLLQHFSSDCEGRLAMRLLDLAQTFGVQVGGEIHIDLPLRHEDLASMIGTTRSRVGFFLQRFTERQMTRRADKGGLIVDPTILVSYIMERMGLAATP